MRITTIMLLLSVFYACNSNSVEDNNNETSLSSENTTAAITIVNNLTFINKNVKDIKKRLYESQSDTTLMKIREHSEKVIVHIDSLIEVITDTSIAPTDLLIGTDPAEPTKTYWGARRLWRILTQLDTTFRLVDPMHKSLAPDYMHLDNVMETWETSSFYKVDGAFVLIKLYTLQNAIGIEEINIINQKGNCP